jgi:cyclophilin family peptidyl-prolyl cis-trans isomerase
MKQLVFLTAAVMLLTASGAGAQEQNPVVVMETNHGTIKIELYPKKAPITVKNFLDYVDAKHYDGTIFHRIIPTFVIQGGGFTPDMKERPTKAAIKNESFNGLSNEKYTIAMARDPEPDTATAQFYINVKDNPKLDKANAKDKFGYCVFGKVIAGQDVVDKIKDVATESRVVPVGDKKETFDDVPKQPIVIKSVYRLKGQ